MKKLAAFFIIIAFIVLASVWAQENKQKPTTNSNLRVTQIAGRRLLDLKKCTDCHTLDGQADDKFTPMTKQRSSEWLTAHAQEKTTIVLREESSERKRKRVLQDEIFALDDYLYQSTAEEREQIETLSANVFEGAYFVYQNNCLNCHAIAGEGKDIGPNLTHVGSKRDKSWFIANLKNPQQFAPESVMPKFDHLPPATLEKMADYLTTLRK
jgi:cbb3-type cytochrome oxidase cytochrome c subunit